jgi:hypothetical protein
VCLDLESLHLSCSSINGAQMHHLLSALASSDDSADMGAPNAMGGGGHTMRVRLMPVWAAAA